MKTTLAAIALLLIPALAGAECRGISHDSTSAGSCAPGLIWDAETGQCVKTTS